MNQAIEYRNYNNNNTKSVRRKIDFSETAKSKNPNSEFHGNYFVSPSMESNKYVKKQYSSSSPKRNTSPKKTVTFATNLELYTPSNTMAPLNLIPNQSETYFSLGAYANSPDPSTVPIPTFERKAISTSPPRSPFADSATMHLRSLLNIQVVA